MNIAMNFLTNLIDLLLLFVFFVYLFKEKPIFKKGMILIIILGLANTFVNQYLGLGSLLGFFIMVVITGWIFIVLFRKKPIFTYLILLVGLILIFIGELVAVNLIVFIFHISPEKLYHINIYRILAIILAKLGCLVLMLILLKSINIRKYQNGKLVYPLSLILIFNVIIIYMTFILYKNMRPNDNLDYVSILGMASGAVIFTWLVFMIMRKIMIQNQKELYWTMREKEYQNQRAYFGNLQDLITSLKAQRHDFNNYLSTVYGMIQLEKYTEAKKFIMSLVDNVSELNDILRANHPVISSLLNLKYQLAKKENINMVSTISLPEEMELDYIDLSIIIGNLLDNSIEACKKIQDGEKVIQIEMFNRDEYIVLNITNSKDSRNLYVKEDSLERYTTKADYDNHGFGLSNVKQVVEKYKGIITIEDLDHTFRVRITLPNKNDMAG
ncbi:sensor histidine kinase [Alkaliphilus serpentinus]|uniref:sensor histidine kinase n=1 Tax=Alkaliphilus serpentinus TaxID=1482731 RepID=UPI00186585A8|nr:GHKL domain-containing protein [Alkaliphilus serpentinus]